MISERRTALIGGYGLILLAVVFARGGAPFLVPLSLYVGAISLQLMTSTRALRRRKAPVLAIGIDRRSNEVDSFETVSVVMATTHPIPAYGGIQLGKAVLEDLARAVHTGAIPMMFAHDIRRGMDIRNVNAGVRKRSDGFWEAFATFDVLASQWRLFQEELKAAGAPGGMSFRASRPFSDEEPSQPDVTLSADAHHFDDHHLLAARRLIAPRGRVRLERMYSFAEEPPPLVAVSVNAKWLLQQPMRVAFESLSAALGHFLNPSRQSIFNFRLSRADGASVEGYLATNDRETLRKAVESLPDLLQGEGVLEYDRGWRRTT